MSRDAIKLTLPLCPTINNYWRRHGHTIYVSKEGKQYRIDAIAAVLNQLGKVNPLTGRLNVDIVVHPRDKRRQDIDNRAKACLDSLTSAGVWLDDSQIDRLTIERGEIVKGGAMRVEIRELA